jgi:hypothetical protein
MIEYKIMIEIKEKFRYLQITLMYLKNTVAKLYLLFMLSVLE